ncbi:MAG: hypothetical protein BMS9Abin37_0556 [Acidobacteriota bacterium]|nr:MAG: hypothetical protein BMS9Abin37_0556 [Acidobacteriota bacterium]
MRILSVLGLVALSASLDAQPALDTKHVVLVTLDGLRWQEVFAGADRALIDRDLWAVSLPWGDVFTSQISTSIPNAIVYGALPRVVCWSMKLSNPLRGFLARPGVQKKLLSLAGKFLDDGPDETKRANARTGFWGRVTTEDGRECSGSITGPSVYALTAEMVVAIALEAEAWEQDGGYFTASMLVGADFLSNREGYKVKMKRASISPDFVTCT